MNNSNFLREVVGVGLVVEPYFYSVISPLKTSTAGPVM
jgi:hypothetical protein